MKTLIELMVFLLSCPMAFAGPKAAVLKTESFKVGASRYTVRFYGPAEFCDYLSFTIQKDGKDALTLKDRCGRETKTSSSAVVADGGWAKVLKLGPAPSDLYLYFFEEPTNSVYRATLVRIASAPTVAFSERVSGRSLIFKDYNGDGLLDLIKVGGRGEPTSDTLSSYDPYLVHLQSNKDGKLKFGVDETLSKKYSAENSYEWHGATGNEALQVDQRGRLYGR